MPFVPNVDVNCGIVVIGPIIPVSMPNIEAPNDIKIELF